MAKFAVVGVEIPAVRVLEIIEQHRGAEDALTARARVVFSERDGTSLPRYER